MGRWAPLFKDSSLQNYTDLCGGPVLLPGGPCDGVGGRQIRNKSCWFWKTLPGVRMRAVVWVHHPLLVMPICCFLFPPRRVGQGCPCGWGGGFKLPELLPHLSHGACVWSP